MHLWVQTIDVLIGPTGALIKPIAILVVFVNELLILIKLPQYRPTNVYILF